MAELKIYIGETRGPSFPPRKCENRHHIDLFYFTTQNYQCKITNQFLIIYWTILLCEYLSTLKNVKKNQCHVKGFLPTGSPCIWLCKIICEKFLYRPLDTSTIGQDIEMQRDFLSKPYRCTYQMLCFLCSLILDSCIFDIFIVSFFTYSVIIFV